MGVGRGISSTFALFPRPPAAVSKRFRSRLVLAGASALVLWVAFFDSHSLWRRAGYARDLSRITEENARMAAENAALQAQIDRGLDDETAEEVAREQYGMRRPGETVYRVLDEDGTDLWSVAPPPAVAPETPAETP